MENVMRRRRPLIINTPWLCGMPVVGRLEINARMSMNVD
jgi:hypothetical protein